MITDDTRIPGGIFTDPLLRAAVNACRGLAAHYDKPVPAAVLRSLILPLRRQLRPLWPASPEWSITTFVAVANCLQGVLIDYPELPWAHRKALRCRYGVDPDAMLDQLSTYLFRLADRLPGM